MIINWVFWITSICVAYMKGLAGLVRKGLLVVVGGGGICPVGVPTINGLAVLWIGGGGSVTELDGGNPNPGEVVVTGGGGRVFALTSPCKCKGRGFTSRGGFWVKSILEVGTAAESTFLVM